MSCWDTPVRVSGLYVAQLGYVDAVYFMSLLLPSIILIQFRCFCLPVECHRALCVYGSTMMVVKSNS